jgi:hypothetical protein
MWPHPHHKQLGGRGLFAVGPDVAKLLAVVTLSKGVLGFIRLFLVGNMAETGHLKRSWDFAALGKVTRNRGKAMDVEPSVDRRAVDICLTLITSKPRSTSPSGMSSAGLFVGRWLISALIGFSALG